MIFGVIAGCLRRWAMRHRSITVDVDDDQIIVPIGAVARRIQLRFRNSTASEAHSIKQVWFHPVDRKTFLHRFGRMLWSLLRNHWLHRRTPTP
jgi:hypothetical protein